MGFLLWSHGLPYLVSTMIAILVIQFCAKDNEHIVSDEDDQAKVAFAIKR